MTQEQYMISRDYMVRLELTLEHYKHRLLKLRRQERLLYNIKWLSKGYKRLWLDKKLEVLEVEVNMAKVEERLGEVYRIEN